VTKILKLFRNGAVGFIDWLDRFVLLHPVRCASSVRSSTLRIESAGNKTNDGADRTSDENAEQRTLVRVRCEDDRADETDKKTRKADDDCTGDAIRQRGTASGRFVTGHTI